MTARINPRNTGTFVGRLAKDPVFFMNGATVGKPANPQATAPSTVTVAVRGVVNDRVYDRESNTYRDVAHFVDFKGFVAKGKTLGIYGVMHKGQVVQIAYEPRQSSYQKDGKTVYRQDLIVRDVQLITTKADERRRAEEAAGKAAQAATVGGDWPQAAGQDPADWAQAIG